MKYLFTTLVAAMAFTLIGSALVAQGPPRDGERPTREGGPREGGPREGGPREGGRRPEGRPGGPGRGPGGPGGNPFMTALDTDKDGELSAEEIKNASKNLLTLDKNKDGKLSGEEIRPPRGPGRGMGPGGPRPDGPRPDGPRPEGDRPGGPRPEGDRPGGPRPEGDRPGRGNVNPEEIIKRIMQLDADKDGKISKAEAPERMKQNFDRVDTDGDGFASEAELKEAFKRMMQAGGRPGGQAGGNRPDRSSSSESGGVRPKRPETE